MYKKKLLLLFVLFIIFIIGSIGGFLFCKTKSNCASSQVDNNSTYLAGWEAAKKRLYDGGYYNDGSEKYPVYSLTGEIKNKSKTDITIKIKPLSPLADQSLDNRIININNIKIYKLSSKNEEQYNKELAEYSVKNKNNPEPTEEPPVKYEKKEINISDLTIGQTISVYSKSDIRNEEKINGYEIVAN
jgi:hypothetical protein